MKPIVCRLNPFSSNITFKVDKINANGSAQDKPRKKMMEFFLLKNCFIFTDLLLYYILMLIRYYLLTLPAKAEIRHSHLRGNDKLELIKF